MIKARIRAVGVTCVASTAVTVLILVGWGGAKPQDVLRLLGLFPVHPLDVVKCVILVAILYLGPLFEFLVVEGNWRQWGNWRFIKSFVWDDWQGWRNIVVGPASEELVFRSLAIPLFLLSEVTIFNGENVHSEFADSELGISHLHCLCVSIDFWFGAPPPSP